MMSQHLQFGKVKELLTPKEIRSANKTGFMHSFERLIERPAASSLSFKSIVVKGRLNFEALNQT
jgi:hypothetical protein